MIHLKIWDPSKPDRSVQVDTFPLSIGRASQNGVCLAAPGVWDRHLEIRLDSGEGFYVSAVGEAIVTVNDHPVKEARLRNGDYLGLGSIKVQFGLSAARGRNWRLREWFVWIGIVLLGLGEILLIYWLPG